MNKCILPVSHLDLPEALPHKPVFHYERIKLAVEESLAGGNLLELRHDLLVDSVQLLLAVRQQLLDLFLVAVCLLKMPAPILHQSCTSIRE
eukprot:scaffold73675_cov23-Prasinocladus_malaysianus.AAC.1